MIDHVWSVLCSHAIIDADTNNVTLYNTIDELHVLQAPEPRATVGLSFEVVSLWVRADPLISATGKCRLTIARPSGEGKLVGELAIDVAKAERSRTKYVFGSFSPSESGRYAFAIEYQAEGELEWRVAAKIPLTVHLPQDTQEPAKTQDSLPVNG